jgi:putative endonuclease
MLGLDPSIQSGPWTCAMAYYVYLMARWKNGTLYTGVTSNLVRRVYEHRQGLADGFTNRYDVKTLVHFEPYEDV